MSTENNHDHSHSGSQICFNLLVQWDKMTFNLLSGCWRAPFKELRLYQNVCMFACVCVSLTDLTVLPCVSLWAVAAVACSLRDAFSSVQTRVCHAGLHLGWERQTDGRWRKD